MPETSKTEDFDHGLPDAFGVVRIKKGVEPSRPLEVKPAEEESPAQPVAEEPKQAEPEEAQPKEAETKEVETKEAEPEVLKDEIVVEAPAEPEEKGAVETEILDEFVQDVMFGLEHAGFAEEGEAQGELAESKLEGLALDQDREEESVLGRDADHEAFFAGWGSESLIRAEADVDDTAADDMEEEEPRFAEIVKMEEPTPVAVSPFELSLAASARATAASPSERDDRKHDELAEAVQSALDSLYGEKLLSQARSPDFESPFSSSPAYVNGGSRGAAVSEERSASADGLSPEEVILNYFSYTPEGISEQNFGFGRQGDQSQRKFFEGSGMPPLGAFSGGTEAFDPFPAAPFPASLQPNSPQSAQRHHPTLENFPVPVTAPEAPASRDSGRLLGAAGIGLVGGIAIAATLAVFVINSYGPHERTFPTAEIKQETPPAATEPARLSAQPAKPAQEQVAEEPAAKEASLPKASSAARVDNQPEIQPPADNPPDLAAADVYGPAGQAIALPITVRASVPVEQTLVSITGIPKDARLNVGVDAGGGNWLLPPRQLKGLTINLPANASGVIPLEVQLLDSNVRTPLSEKVALSVHVQSSAPAWKAKSEAGSEDRANAPAFSTRTIEGSGDGAGAQGNSASAKASFNTQTVRAPREQAATAPSEKALPSLAAVTPAEEETRRAISPVDPVALMREGDLRMKEGDIMRARALYIQAAETGDAKAALAVGQSYDPLYFMRLEKANAEPDAAAALEWYRKAMDRGATKTAKARIDDLKKFLAQ